MWYGVVLDGRRSDVVSVGVVLCSTEYYFVVRSSTGVVVFLWGCFYGGVVEFLWWWCFCGGVFCGGVFVVVFL